jgi:hypothetical protein
VMSVWARSSMNAMARRVVAVMASWRSEAVGSTRAVLGNVVSTVVASSWAAFDLISGWVAASWLPRTSRR